MSRPIREWRSASLENYNEFCKQNPEIEIDYKTFKSIIYDWNEMFANYIMDTGERVKIPYGFGPITISKYKRKLKYHTGLDGKRYPNLSIDWAATNKEGKMIYHLNSHTDGFKYFWYWSPSESYIKLPAIWSLKMARKHSRSLVQYLKNVKDQRKHLYKQWIIKRFK